MFSVTLLFIFMFLEHWNYHVFWNPVVHFHIFGTLKFSCFLELCCSFSCFWNPEVFMFSGTLLFILMFLEPWNFHVFCNPVVTCFHVFGTLKFSRFLEPCCLFSCFWNPEIFMFSGTLLFIFVFGPRKFSCFLESCCSLSWFWNPETFIFLESYYSLSGLWNTEIYYIFIILKTLYFWNLAMLLVLELWSFSLCFRTWNFSCF